MNGVNMTIAEQYAVAGFPLIPLVGKTPLDNGWPTAKVGQYAPRDRENYGVVIPSRVLVVDVDPRNFKSGDQPLSRLFTDIGLSKRPDTFVVKTGSGGFHIYFSKPEGLEVRAKLKAYPGIDFKSIGAQVVGPGSIHPETGKNYEVMYGSPDTLFPAPQKLLEILRRTSTGLDNAGIDDYSDDDGTRERFYSWLKSAEPAVQGDGGDAGTFKVAAHGRDLGLSPKVCFELMVSSGWNDRCQPPWHLDQLQEKVSNAYRYANGPVGSKHPSADFAPIEPAIKKEDEKEEMTWVLDKAGRPTVCFHNLLNYLKSKKSGLFGVFAYNQFLGDVVFVRPAPWHDGSMPPNGVVNDYELKLLKAYLVRRFAFEAPICSIEEAVTVAAHQNKFHPVREYLTALKWDGVKRLDSWLVDYAGVEDSKYVRSIGRKVLCAAVTRVFRPGAKFDHVLILEGRQGIGKSMLCEILGGDWFTSAPIDPHSRDTIDTLQGKWIVELAEMEITRRADMNALKAFITRTHDKVRLAYGRRSTEFARQCIFIGSINPGADGKYLQDQTGNRRFWPVEMRGLDFAGFKRDRAQLWAEAVAAIRGGERLIMSREEADDALRAAARRQAESPWTEVVAVWLSGVKDEFITARRVFLEALGGLDKQLDYRAYRDIACVMRDLGWTQEVRRVDGVILRGYVRGRFAAAGHTSEDGLKKELEGGRKNNSGDDVLGNLV